MTALVNVYLFITIYYFVLGGKPYPRTVSTEAESWLNKPKLLLTVSANPI